MRWALLLLLGSAPGCGYRVALSSTPAGAQVTLPDGSVAITPVEVRLHWRPFERQRLTATAPGYRPLTLDLRRSEVRWAHYARDTLLRPATLSGAVRGEVELLLIPDHGPAGTWTGDDVP